MRISDWSSDVCSSDLEFAAGPFVYRIADHIPAADRRHFRTTSASRLPAFLDADPPQAIIVKNNGRSDGELRDYAIANGYRPVAPDRSGELSVLVRPDSGKKGCRRVKLPFWLTLFCVPQSP